MNKTDVLLMVCGALNAGDKTQAAEHLKRHYPFDPMRLERKGFNAIDCVRVFIRDGFIDRYSGQRLVFPGALRLLSAILPGEFPFNRNWRMDATHIAYWELFPTVDHKVPVSRGGLHDESNWLSTSQLRNSAKSNWTPEELGWKVFSPGNFAEWDGLMTWFVAYLKENPGYLKDEYIRRWHSGAVLGLVQIGRVGLASNDEIES